MSVCRIDSRKHTEGFPHLPPPVLTAGFQALFDQHPAVLWPSTICFPVPGARRDLRCQARLLTLSGATVAGLVVSNVVDQLCSPVLTIGVSVPGWASQGRQSLLRTSWKLW